MKLAITGASGFLGKYVVAAALRQGFQVQAILRPTTDASQFSWHIHPNLEIMRLDLRSPQGLVTALQHTDAVIHLAAVKAGDFYDQFAGTVIATENLLAALPQTSVHRLVAVSTFSVYNYLKLKPGDTLDEQSALEDNPLNRDEYAQTKLIQETLVRDFEQQTDTEVVILRPGMIYGRECLWHALLGAELGKNRWLKIGGQATLPMTYVENCADAIIAAVQPTAAIGQTLNIVDNALPTQNEYIEGLLQHTDRPPQLIPVSWALMQGMSQLAWWVRQTLLAGKARLPGILVPAKLYARFKPLQYRNTKIKEVLNWQPQYTFEEALSRSYSSEDLLHVEALS